MNPTTLQIIASTLFGIAVIHTFSSAFFERLAHKQPNHAGLWHLLGEVEAVFGFWAMILIVFMAFAAGGYQPSVEYLESRNYTEPLFVFAIMVVAASRPVLHFASELVRLVSGLLSQLFRINNVTTSYFVTLSLVPLLGSFITEPAAMTLAAQTATSMWQSCVKLSVCWIKTMCRRKAVTSLSTAMVLLRCCRKPLLPLATSTA